MNEKVLRHKEICDGLNELYARKNHDYGDSFHTTFVEEGLAMARIRLGDKFSRGIEALIRRYEMEQGDDVWLCTYKLKEIGCDLEKWEKERGDQ